MLFDTALRRGCSDTIRTDKCVCSCPTMLVLVLVLVLDLNLVVPDSHCRCSPVGCRSWVQGLAKGGLDIDQ
jgi:hypothetical protein